MGRADGELIARRESEAAVSEAALSEAATVHEDAVLAVEIGDLHVVATIGSGQHHCGMRSGHGVVVEGQRAGGLVLTVIFGDAADHLVAGGQGVTETRVGTCLLYTSDAA